MHLQKKITTQNNGKNCFTLFENYQKCLSIFNFPFDFSFLHRQEITNVRQRSLWELPQTDVTSKVKEEFDFQDAWTLAGRPGTSKTCRFDTHIDYIFCNSALLSKYAIDRVEHVEDTASDHNMVIATFKTL